MKSRRRRQRAPNRRVRSKELSVYLRLGLPGGVVVFLLRLAGMLWGWGWLVLTAIVYFVVGYMAADERARRTFGHRRVKSSYVGEALPTALVAWLSGWLAFVGLLIGWLLFQDVFGRVEGLIAAVPWTLPLAFIAGIAGGQWRQAS